MEPGETIKSLETLALETQLSVQNIRTVVNHLKSTGELTERQHGKHRLLKLKNYKQYQLTNRELTSNQQGTNRELTADKESKNIRNIDTKVSTTKVDKRNKDIDLILLALKKTIGIEHFADSHIERMMAKHCLNLMEKIGKEEFKVRLDFLLDDEFTAKNCNKIKFVYNNIKAFKKPTLSSNTVRV